MNYKKDQSITDCKFEVIENAGHMPWLDQPEKSGELIMKLLGE